MVYTGTGEKEKEQKGDTKKVGGSANSVKQEKRSTRKTSLPTAVPKFTLDDAYEILSQAFGIAEGAGSKITVSATDGKVHIDIDEADFVAGMIVKRKVPQTSGVPQSTAA